ncbi:hypothetical protein J43TS9_12240 [Paenibacillus cineris]|nr:hypothetical protein J43TS9_12240 [Paenibacillus cineris]
MLCDLSFLPFPQNQNDMDELVMTSKCPSLNGVSPIVAKETVYKYIKDLSESFITQKITS